jgi:hypothetical protein
MDGIAGCLVLGAGLVDTKSDGQPQQSVFMGGATLVIQIPLLF